MCSFGANMQASLWKRVLIGNVEILGFDWSNSRSTKLANKNLKSCTEPKKLLENISSFFKKVAKQSKLINGF